MPTAAPTSSPAASVAMHAVLLARFQAVRAATMELIAPLSPEDLMVQSSPDASPVKWHLAHTSWFFETFVLREFLPGYQSFHPDFHWLFNSYYNSLGEMPEKKLRASFSRPSLDSILAYRSHVDAAIARLLKSSSAGSDQDEPLRRITLGLHHEQQHQELIATDIKHALFTNPLHPAYIEAASNHGAPSELGGSLMPGAPPIRGRIANGWDAGTPSELGASLIPGAPPIRGLIANGWDASADTTSEVIAPPLEWIVFDGGLTQIGIDSDPDPIAFAFDNETPRHTVYLAPFSIASRPVTCAEYLAFIDDNGYTRPELWLSEGWATMRSEAWQAPLYWQPSKSAASGWSIYTLHGVQPLESLSETPVCHLSFFEADAYARWFSLREPGCRLPTEFEWEHAAASAQLSGKFIESAALHPTPAASIPGLQQLFGDTWEWTSSGYTGYPGYKPLPGALGEYNGKFMSSQVILRGGSCVTPATHIRPTYRNFFPPGTRWQFSGVRLAK